MNIGKRKRKRIEDGFLKDVLLEIYRFLKDR